MFRTLTQDYRCVWEKWQESSGSRVMHLKNRTMMDKKAPDEFLDLIISRRSWTGSLLYGFAINIAYNNFFQRRPAVRKRTCSAWASRIEMSYFHKIRHYLSCRKVQTLYVVNSQASCDHFESLKMPEIRSECSYVSHCPWIQSWELIIGKCRIYRIFHTTFSIW